MSIHFWVKFRFDLEYVFDFHDKYSKIWSCFPRSFSEQFKFHMDSVKPGESDKCSNFHIFSDPIMKICFCKKNYFFWIFGRMGGI